MPVPVDVTTEANLTMVITVSIQDHVPWLHLEYWDTLDGDYVCSKGLVDVQDRQALRLALTAIEWVSHRVQAL